MPFIDREFEWKYFVGFLYVCDVQYKMSTEWESTMHVLLFYQRTRVALHLDRRNTQRDRTPVVVHRCFLSKNATNTVSFIRVNER